MKKRSWGGLTSNDIGKYQRTEKTWGGLSLVEETPSFASSQQPALPSITQKSKAAPQKKKKKASTVPTTESISLPGIKQEQRSHEDLISILESQDLSAVLESGPQNSEKSLQPLRLARARRREKAFTGNPENVSTRTLPNLIKASNIPVSDDPFVVSLQAWGQDDTSKEGHIKVEGKVIRNITKDDCGLYLTFMEPDVREKYKVVETVVFDINKSFEAAQNMHEYVTKKMLGTVILGVSAREITRHMAYGSGVLTEIGLDTSKLSEGSSVVFVGKKGYPEFLTANFADSGAGPVTLERDLLYDPLKEAIKQAKLDKEEEYLNDTDPQFVPVQQFLITADDLKRRKKELQNAVSSKVSLTREQIFDKHKVYDYFPLLHMKDAFLSKGVYYTRIDLGGVEQLTDMFFHVVRVFVKDSIATKHVSEFVLSGCHHITDQGVLVMAKTFPNLREVQLYGCRRITEKTLFNLTNLCSKFELLQAQATDIAVICVPQYLKDDSSLFSWTCGLRLWGCPLVSPPASNLPPDETLMTGGKYLKDWVNMPKVDVYKMVVVNMPGVPFSLASLLAKKETVPCKPAQYYPECKISSQGSQKFNVIECSQELLHLFVGKRTIYVLVYNPDDFEDHVLSTMSYIYSKVQDPVFVLVGMSQSTDQTTDPKSLRKKADSPAPDLKNPSWLKSLESIDLHLQRLAEISTNFKKYSLEQIQTEMKSLNFRQQKMVSLAFDMNESLHRLPELKHELFLDDKESWDAVSKSLATAAGQIDEVYPMYTRLAYKCLNLAKQIPKPDRLIPEETYVRMAKCCMLRVEDSGQELSASDLQERGMGTNSFPYKKCLQVLEMLGVSVCLPPFLNATGASPSLTALNLEWFTQLLSASYDLPAQVSTGNGLFMPDSTPQWIRQEALTALTDSAGQQMPLQKEYVECFLQAQQGICTHDGLFLRLSDLPEDPTYPLEDASQNALLSVECQYTIGLPQVPRSVVNNLLRKVVHFAGARKAKILCMSKSCVVLQELPAEISLGFRQVSRKVLGQVHTAAPATKASEAHATDKDTQGAVTLTVRLPWLLADKSSDESEETNGLRFMDVHCQNVYSDYKVLLEMIFAEDRLFWDQEVKCSWIEKKNNDHGNERDWLDIQSTPDHVFKPETKENTENGASDIIAIEETTADTDQVVDGNCKSCQTSTQEAALLWNIYHSVKPCLVDQMSLAMSPENQIQDVRQFGNLVILNPGAPSILAKEAMSPWGFSRFEVLWKAGKNILIGVRIVPVSGTARSYMCSLEEGEVKDSQNKPYVTGLPNIRIGGTLGVQLLEGSTQDEHIVVFQNQGETMCTIPVPATAQIYPYFEKLGQTTLLLYMMMAPSGGQEQVIPCKMSSQTAFRTQLASETPLSMEGLPPLPASLLPHKLSPKLLYFPCISQVWGDPESLAIHFLCSSKDGVHLVKEPNSRCLIGNDAYKYLLETPNLKKFLNKVQAKIPDDFSQKSLSAFVMYCMMMLIAAKYVIPKDMTGLEELDQADETNFEKANSMVKYLVEVVLSGLFLVTDGKLALDDDMRSNQAISEAVSAMWNEANSAQHNNNEVESGGATMSDDILLCRSHFEADSPGLNLSAIPLDKFTHHGHLITELNFSNNSLSELPDDLWQVFPELTCLLLSNNQLKGLPPNPGHLEMLDISKNQIKELPDGFEKCKDTLTSLNISSNPMMNIPDVVFICTNLTDLQASNIILEELQPDIANLWSLSYLDLTGHQMAALPAEFANLVSLEVLMLDGLHWLDTFDSVKSFMSRSHFDQFLQSHAALDQLDPKAREELFSGGSSGTLAGLDYKGIQRLNAELFAHCPRFGDKSDDCGGVPSEIFALTNLKTLSLGFHGITKITGHFSQLTNLEHLDVSNNPKMESIAGEVGMLPLKSLNLRNCPVLKTPPREIARRGFMAVYGYLKRLLMGSVTCRRTKLMLVGLGGAGKTSLVKALTSGRYQTEGTQGEAITDGIDITTWQVKNDEEEGELTFSVWDFAGQTVYYNTHQFFLSNRAVYLLLWNLRLGHEHAGLDFWLSSIACHAPKAPILVIGTHKDQVEKFSLPKEALAKRYPQIKGFHTISSYTGDGVEELATTLVTTTLLEKYMGEKIPEAWLNLEKKVLGMRSVLVSTDQSEQEAKETERKRVRHNTLPWQQVEAFAVECGIFDKLEIRQAVQFLHDLGSLQHFQHPQLKSQVVINPQWIVDVMACVVSVNNTAIQEGQLLHKDIGEIWKKYDSDLHPWLLTLTEQFDLTFALADEKINVVPCLMPETEPEYTWPEVVEGSGLRETKMLYVFEYLPAGLFNRAQVRLRQFCDSSVLWKRGCLLKKNEHLGLLTQPRDCRVLVRVQGSRPENILFLVHEVFEALIVESFHGVSYDFQVPCGDCLKVGSHDPCMFAASKIRRATELKAPFLQCDQYFHTLTLTELHAMMPPEAGSDFDVHLARNMNDLHELSEELRYDVFMFYSGEDMPNKKDKKDNRVNPRQIYQDLENAGLVVWFPDDPSVVSLKQVAVTMKDSKTVLVCISDGFVSDDHCCSVFYYARQTLHKKVQVAVVGQGMGWKMTNLGLYLSSDVFVNISNPNRYPVKIKDLINVLSNKTTKKKNLVYPSCFISYCWSNSQDAIDKGSRKVPGALGWGDPRKFKEILEKEGVACWMDIEQVGKTGLFEDIAEGLRHAKVMVVCVSDEYADSRNCCMELRFAAVTLKIPLVIAVVGTGYKWESSEIGMLALGWPKVMFQYESPVAYEHLAKLVMDQLPKESLDMTNTGISENTIEPSPPQSPIDNNHLGFQEMLELAQRKFLRQLTGYSDVLDTMPYPRLVVIDFLMQQELTAIKQAASSKDGSQMEEQDDLDDKTSDVMEQKTSEDTADDHITDQLCIRILCEHEQGWHISGSPLPIPTMTEDSRQKMLITAAPYAARILTILRHTSLSLACLRSEAGNKLIKLFEENSKLDCDYEEEYCALRAAVMTHCDPNRTMGDVARCQLASGKILWLCKDHQDGDRVTVLEEDAPDVAVLELPAEGLTPEQIMAQAKSHESASEREPRAKSARPRPPLKRESTMAHLRHQANTSAACCVM